MLALTGAQKYYFVEGVTDMRALVQKLIRNLESMLQPAVIAK